MEYFGLGGSLVGSSRDTKGKVQVGRQVKLLPVPELLPESIGLYTQFGPVDGPAQERDDQDHGRDRLAIAGAILRESRGNFCDDGHLYMVE